MVCTFICLFIYFSLYSFGWQCDYDYDHDFHINAKEKTHTNYTQKENFAVIQFLISDFVPCLMVEIYFRNEINQIQTGCTLQSDILHSNIDAVQIVINNNTNITKPRGKKTFLIKSKSLAHLLPHSATYFDYFV